MSQATPDQLALPLHPDDGDQQELIRSAQQHLAALRTARRLGVGVKANRTLKQKDVEIVGLDPQAAAKDPHHHHGSLSSRFARVWRHGHAPNGHEDEQEVDDSWFRVDDEEARRTVKLSIGKVPKRAAALVGRTVSRGNRQRRSRRHHGRGDEIVSDDGGGLDSDGGGGDRYELKGMDTAQRGGDDTFARRNRTYTHRHHHHDHLTPITTTTSTAPASEIEDAEDDGDSFVTLELPARFGTGGVGGGGSNAAFPILGYTDSPNGSLSRIVSPASPSSRSATLFPVDSIVSAGGGGGAPLSSSGSASGTPTHKKQQPSQQQQQILTVDEVPDRSGSRPRISRKATALTMTSGSGVLTDVKDKDKDKDKDRDRDDDVDASSRVIETPQSKSPRLSAHRKLHKQHRPASTASAKHPHHSPHHPHRHHHHHSINKGKDLAAETSGATAFELQIAEALKKAGVIRDEEERVESDVLWEHQRGLVVFGLPKFSGNALFQADPPHWCDASFKPSPFNPHTFPCKPYWVWRDSEFMIDMSGDKDEEGWSYAFRFRSHYWRGEPQPIRSFVRRRRWIRTRVYRPEPLLSGAVTHAHALRNALGLAEVAAHPELGPCGANPNPSRSPSPSPTPSPCGDTPAPPEPIHDLRTACAALPIADDDKVLLFADSSSPAAFLPGGAVDPRNPFVSFRQIKTDAAAAMSSALAPGGQKASELEPMWREAVREINYRRAIGVMRARTRVDRQRVELFRLWFGEYDAASKRANRLSVGGGDGGEASASAAVVVKADGTEGAHETAQKEGAKAIMAATRVIARKERSEVWDPEAGEGTEADVDDVWDVVEHRLDDILLLFDYQLSRQTFLTMLLDIHPVKHAYHRYRGYDASSAQRKATLERALEARLVFYETAMELVRQYGGKGGWMPEPGSPLDP